MAFPAEKMSHAFPLLVANYPHMNFTQMHERLRMELLRRINRGTLSVSLLARQTGFGQVHLSNFLHTRRQLSLQALDRVMAAQHMEAEDLLPVIRSGTETTSEPGGDRVPIVAQASTLFEPYIRRSAVHSLLQLPKGALKSLQPRPSKQRRAWQRFCTHFFGRCRGYDPAGDAGSDCTDRSPLQFAPALPARQAYHLCAEK